MYRRNVLNTAAMTISVFAVVGSLVLAQGPSGASGRPPGQVAKVEEAGSTTASVGDLIQIQVTYPVVPGSFLDNLDVVVTGPSARLATVAATRVTTPDGRAVFGSGALSAFVVAESEGDAVVKVTPVKQGGGRDEPREYRLKITKRQEP